MLGTHLRVELFRKKGIKSHEATLLSSSPWAMQGTCMLPEAHSLFSCLLERIHECFLQGEAEACIPSCTEVFEGSVSLKTQEEKQVIKQAHGLEYMINDPSSLKPSTCPPSTFTEKCLAILKTRRP